MDNINLSEKQINELFFDITQINDEEVSDVLEMFTLLISEDYDILKRPFADLSKKFENNYE